MRKNLIPVILIVATAMLVVTLGGVSAMSTYDNSVIANMTDIGSRINYEFQHGLFIFTTWGQANGCSVLPDKQGWMSGSKSIGFSSVSCSLVNSQKCAIDVWYDNTIYLGSSSGPPSSPNFNNYLKEVSGTGISFSGTQYPYYYYEVYACPISAPTQPVTKTSAYVCNTANGNWNYVGQYAQNDYCSYDTSGMNKCWCSGTNNFYVDQNRGVRCAASPLGSWCPAPASNQPPVVPTTPNPNPIVSCNLGDADHSGDISRSELGTYISGWIAGTNTRDDLNKVLMEWSNGC